MAFPQSAAECLSSCKGFAAVVSQRWTDKIFAVSLFCVSI